MKNKVYGNTDRNDSYGKASCFSSTISVTGLWKLTLVNYENIQNYDNIYIYFWLETTPNTKMNAQIIF